MDYHEALAKQQQTYAQTSGFYGWVRDHRRFSLWVSFLLVALAVELPFLLNNQLFGGWDQQFHVNRIEELYLAAKNGMWHNAISTYTFRGAGLGIQIFYPYVFLYPYALLRLIGIPGILALHLGNMFYIVLSSWLSYWCMQKFLTLRQSLRPLQGAWLFSVLYNLSGYMVFNETVRFDLPEAQSMMWYPVLFLGVYMILTGANRGWLPASIGAIMLTYTHVLSALLAAGMVVLVVLIGWRRLNKWQVWRDLLLTGVITGLVSLPELLVMVKTTATIKVATPLIGSLARQAITPPVAVGYGLANITKTHLLTHGVTLGTIVLVALIALWLGFRRLDGFGKMMTVLSTVLFWATTSLFPWFLFEHTPINVIQHPWRLYTFISLFVLVAVVLLAERIDLRFKWQTVILGAALLLNLVTSGLYVGMAKAKVTPTTYHHFATSARYFDYAPQSSVKHLHSIYHHQAIIKQPVGKAIAVHVKQRPLPNGVAVTVPKQAQGGQMDLPLFNYGGGYEVKTQSGQRLAAKLSKRGTIQVTVPEHTQTLTVHYRNGLW